MITNANIHTPSYLGTALPYDHSLLVFSYSSYNSISDDNIESDHIQLDMLKLEKLLDINPMDLNRDAQPEANGDIDLNGILVLSTICQKVGLFLVKSRKVSMQNPNLGRLMVERRVTWTSKSPKKMMRLTMALSKRKSSTPTIQATRGRPVRGQMTRGMRETDPEANDRENTDESGYEMQSDAGEHTTDGEDSEDFEDY